MATARARIRTFMDSDIAEIVELSLLAWEPAFESFEKHLGPKVFPILYPDWRKSQREGVGAPAGRVVVHRKALKKGVNRRLLRCRMAHTGPQGGNRGHGWLHKLLRRDQ
jgi:hypothetical protein